MVVVVTLYGGNDGINTLVPYASNAYHDARPELACTEPDVLHLDSDLGLNPAMKGHPAQAPRRTRHRAGVLLSDMSTDPRGRDVAGSPVNGGLSGDEPGLTDLHDGDLKPTTDFRDVYAELLGEGIGSDPTPGPRSVRGADRSDSSDREQGFLA